MKKRFVVAVSTLMISTFCMLSASALADFNATTTARLNLRTAPSQSAPRIVLIPRKTVVDVLSFGPEWSYIRYGIHEGYAMSKYLNLDTSAPVPEPVTPPSGKTAYAQVVTAKGGLNMRKSASTGSQRIMVIPQYAYVEVLEAGSKWCYVTYGGRSGYVQTAYLKML